MKSKTKITLECDLKIKNYQWEMKLLQPLCLLVVENPPTLAVHSDNDIILITARPVTWRRFFHDHRHHRDVLLHLSAMPVHNQTRHVHGGIKYFDSPDDLGATLVSHLCSCRAWLMSIFDTTSPYTSTKSERTRDFASTSLSTSPNERYISEVMM